MKDFSGESLMRFSPTKIKGAFIVDIEKFADERGFFARSWCEKEFTERGLNPRLVQCNISLNLRKGTLRGMHYQSPHPEAKLVRVTRGAILDVIIDLRSSSPTFLQHIIIELNDDNRTMLYVPENCAHGFLTLIDFTEVFYQMSEFYYPSEACGFRWNDPAFGIKWPEGPKIISERDQAYPDFVHRQ
jgi:dTDP-4-dehydrorhamnose 3,5-epimerase